MSFFYYKENFLQNNFFSILIFLGIKIFINKKKKKKIFFLLLKANFFLQNDFFLEIFSAFKKKKFYKK